MTELTSGIMSSANHAPVSKPANKNNATATTAAEKEEAEIDASTDELLKRLQAL